MSFTDGALLFVGCFVGAILAKLLIALIFKSR